jgi:aspartate-semialdehyde dehydrogenase
MLYAMLYNGSDEDWKRERTWIIKFLADGMVGSDDWKVLKRRHTWDLLASLFQSESDAGNTGLRTGIVEVGSNEQLRNVFALLFHSVGIGESYLQRPSHHIAHLEIGFVGMDRNAAA